MDELRGFLFGGLTDPNEAWAVAQAFQLLDLGGRGVPFGARLLAGGHALARLVLPAVEAAGARGFTLALHAR